jgi:hypothetical protein
VPALRWPVTVISSSAGASSKPPSRD